MKPKDDKHPCERMEVWQKAHELTLLVVRQTAVFAEESHREIGSRLRRLSSDAAASLTAGLATWPPEAKRRLYLRSLERIEELRYHVVLCRDLGLPVEHEKMTDLCDSVSRMLMALTASTGRRRKQKSGAAE